MYCMLMDSKFIASRYFVTDEIYGFSASSWNMLNFLTKKFMSDKTNY
jgi:hypothetical protein